MSAKLNHLNNLRQIFQKSVESVRPANLLSAANNYCLKPKPTSDGQLNIQIQSKILDISQKRCHVVGFGKAVLGLAVKLEESLEERLISGILSIPCGTIKQFAKVPEMQLKATSKIQIYEGAPNNQPDEVALQAAIRIKSLASSMTKDDILFVLISGGGSALLPLPRPNIELDEKMQLTRNLANRGASIDEMNLVRIALSDIKGGRLAAAARNAFAVISFVISDIVGDPIDLIASGPTCAPLTRRTTAQEVLVKYDLWKTLTQNIRKVIESPPFEEATTPGVNNSIFVVGDNRVATATAIQIALECGYKPFIASTTIQGELQEVVTLYKQFLSDICEFRNKEINKEKLKQRFPFDTRVFQHFVKTLELCEATGQPLLLIFAGEPTVKVTGNGLGGRNQELALRMSLEFYNQSNYNNTMYFLSAGTDGIDGPTIAAGALGCSQVIEEFFKTKPNATIDTIKGVLMDSDSYNYYKQLNGGQFHVITGHTGTNVMDLHLLLIDGQ